MHALKRKRILVTGGSGFLGRHVCLAMNEFDPARIVTFRSADYNLLEQQDVRRLLRNTTPEVVVHLAGVVGGIGANRANPGKYFYENAIMGIQLMEEARKAGIEKFVSIATICAYPKNAQVPFRESALWDG